jgi:hypothetical protein
LLTDLEILHQLCDEERASGMKSAVDRRVKDSKFPELNTVDGFDFDFDPVRKKLRARYRDTTTAGAGQPACSPISLCMARWLERSRCHPRAGCCLGVIRCCDGVGRQHEPE